MKTSASTVTTILDHYTSSRGSIEVYNDKVQLVWKAKLSEYKTTLRLV